MRLHTTGRSSATFRKGQLCSTSRNPPVTSSASMNGSSPWYTPRSASTRSRSDLPASRGSHCRALASVRLARMRSSASRTATVIVS